MYHQIRTPRGSLAVRCEWSDAEYREEDLTKADIVCILCKRKIFETFSLSPLRNFEDTSSQASSMPDVKGESLQYLFD